MAALSAGLLGLGTCGGGGDPLQVDCRQGTLEMVCVAPGQMVQGSKMPPTFDPNGCQIRSEVTNSCCNPAMAGPVLKGGQCCYAFCGGSCC